MGLMSELVTLLSLNLTLALVTAGQVAGTFPITGATATTPIRVTSPAHGVAPARVVHAVITGVTGEDEANGLRILTPVDPDTFELSTIDGQGHIAPVVGVNGYTGGGTISYSFPDYGILLGRHLLDLSSSVASPRVVFIPVDEPAWNFEPYGGIGTPTASPPVRGTPEQQTQKLQPQLATTFPTFDVYITAAAVPPSPAFGDFDAVQTVRDALYVVMFSGSGSPRAKVLGGTWPSQKIKAGTKGQRGQQWVGRVQFQQPVVTTPLAYVPPGVSLVLDVFPVNPASGDDTIISITATT